MLAAYVFFYNFVLQSLGFGMHLAVPKLTKVKSVKTIRAQTINIVWCHHRACPNKTNI